MTFKRIFVALAFACVLVLRAPQADAAQGSGCMPTTGIFSGLVFSQDVTAGLAALISTNSGSTAPATDCTGVPVLGQYWLNTGTSPYQLEIYDGASWLILGTVNPSTHVWTPVSTTVAIANGGTGATTAAGALTNLGALSSTTAASTYATISSLSSYATTAALSSYALSSSIPTAAAASDVLAGTSTTKMVTPNALAASAAIQTLTYGSTTSWNMAAGYNAAVTLTGNISTLTITNPVVGQTYTLQVVQDSTGSRTVTWPSGFDWGAAGTPTLTATASKTDLVTLICTNASTPTFIASIAKGF